MKKAWMMCAALLLMVTACTAQPAKPTPQPTPETVKEAVAAPVVTPRPTPTLAPKPTPTPDEPGKVVLAEGFYYFELSEGLKARITGKSYPADEKNCKIGYDDLRCVKLLHYDFEGIIHEGELIVHALLAAEVTEIFCELYKAQYPLYSVRLIDDFYADDDLSMEANNTSAFNYRQVEGSKLLSLHSFGAAIDINPFFNPYVEKGRVSPESAAAFADRSRDFAGRIDKNDLCYKLFTERGWTWGGQWRSCQDYHHFQKDLGFER